MTKLKETKEYNDFKKKKKGKTQKKKKKKKKGINKSKHEIEPNL